MRPSTCNDTNPEANAGEPVDDGFTDDPKLYFVDEEATHWSKTDGGGSDGVDSGAEPGQPQG